MSFENASPTPITVDSQAANTAPAVAGSGIVAFDNIAPVLIITPHGLPPSLYLDWDADVAAKITKDGSGNVSSWDNALGSEALVQATANNQPLWQAAQINGKAAIKFRNTPSNNYLGMASGLHNLATGYAWFVVFKALAIDARVLFCTSAAASANSSVFMNGTVNATFRHSGSEALLNIPTNLGAWQLLTGRYDGTNIYGSLNNAAEVSDAIGAPSAARGFYFGVNGVLTGPGDMQIARCGWFNRSLDASELATVKQVLNAAYGLW